MNTFLIFINGNFFNLIKKLFKNLKIRFKGEIEELKGIEPTVYNS